MDKDQIITSLQQEIETLREENRRLKERALRDFMERAIKDDKLSQSIAPDMGQFYEEALAPWYVCILFYGKRVPSNALPKKSPLDMVSEIFSDTLYDFGQPYFFDTSGIVACLLNVELDEAPEDAPKAGQTFCSDLRAALEEVFHAHYTQMDVSHIAISHASKLEQGPRSIFRSAVSVAERRTSGDPTVCMETKVVSPAKETLQQIFSLEPLFWRQIQQKAFYDAASTLDQIIQLTNLEQGSLERTLASVFSRMELALHTAGQENDQDVMADPLYMGLLQALTQVESYQEMREVCYDILANLEDRFYTPENARNKKMPGIEAYIRENYSDQMMGATSIADQFKISPSYLSRIFKADMGIGIVDYIHAVRTEAAKKLLLETELSTNDIAVEVGFSNRWVLTRVFKKVVGVTPGAYRAQNTV